ncbi:L-TYPE LECTIN-DOMAIN CONTAINING RECEPTOR KINASE VIII.1 [Salix viminalis]|uniref:L-TYPE LECTIN-DOMAIN CONTAINING RECEPTOR KINASE VIII.1 n=1 Tax=Salix viminalis TaxID=40686 RepID=A0A9Q0U739_SALVM|nr:L-TYPE LECTIN-DOMAIN CONTAINING RECEPTOR KINASE VIII.1 [Salix viminalis]
MASPSQIQQFCIFLFILFNLKDPPLLLASRGNVSFEFPSFNLRNLTLLGDSYLRRGVIGLTRDVTVPSSSSGTLIYDSPIPFSDQESNTTASFSTRFSFSILDVNENSYGDGLSFFLSQDNQTLGSPGGYLGLVNSSQLTRNSLNSIKTADPISQDIDLKSGDLITAWIDYENDQRVLNVYMSYSSLKPGQPLLNVDIDLSEYLRGDMYVGFSGSTEGSTELHLVANWSFRTSGFPPANPNSNPNPHNVSDSSSVTVTAPIIPVSNAASKRHKSLVLGLGIAGPALFCASLMAFGYISVRKWQKIRRVKSLKAELVTGPKEFSYKELKLATRGFHSSRIIGRGAFGNVYKATFNFPGSIAAVKRSKHSHEVDWVWGLHGEGNIIEAADPRLKGEFEEEMRKLLLVGLSCANPDSTGRPTMRRVLQILNGEAEPVAVPRKKPSLTFSCSLALTLEEIVSGCD